MASSPHSQEIPVERSLKRSLRPLGKTDPLSSAHTHIHLHAHTHTHTHLHTHTCTHTPSLLELGLLSLSSKENLHSSKVSTFWGFSNKWPWTTPSMRLHVKEGMGSLPWQKRQAARGRVAFKLPKALPALGGQEAGPLAATSSLPGASLKGCPP